MGTHAYAQTHARAHTCIRLHPMMMKVYDGLVVNIIINCYRNKFNAQTACVTLCVMLLSLPKLLFKSLQGSAGESGANLASIASRGGGSVKAAAGDVVKQRSCEKQRRAVARAERELARAERARVKAERAVSRVVVHPAPSVSAPARTVPPKAYAGS